MSSGLFQKALAEFRIESETLKAQDRTPVLKKSLYLWILSLKKFHDSDAKLMTFLWSCTHGKEYYGGTRSHAHIVTYVSRQPKGGDTDMGPNIRCL